MKQNQKNMEAFMKWYDVRDWGITGKGWADTERFYDRLPRQAAGRVPVDVWTLSRHSTGLYTEFITNAPEMYARWTLVSSQLAMPHMPATSVSGLDLYAQDASGCWRWVAVGQPETAPEVELCLTYGLEKGRRLYRLYLPLFNGIESLSIGVPEDSIFEPGTPQAGRPLVMYGTSIVHGIAASRAGMCHTAILGRWLSHPIVNLGFSGRGKMELVLTEFLAEIDACAYVIDCLPNMEPALVQERAEAFIKRLHDLRPNIPIVLVEDRSYANGWIVPRLGERNCTSRAILRDISTRFMSVESSWLHYVTGNELLGDDDDATVDGTHPTDLGFIRISEYLRPILAPLIEPSGACS